MFDLNVCSRESDEGRGAVLARARSLGWNCVALAIEEASTSVKRDAQGAKRRVIQHLGADEGTGGDNGEGGVGNVYRGARQEIVSVSPRDEAAFEDVCEGRVAAAAVFIPCRPRRRP